MNTNCYSRLFLLTSLHYRHCFKSCEYETKKPHSVLDIRPRTQAKILSALVIHLIFEAWGGGAVRGVQIPFILRLSESQRAR